MITARRPVFPGEREREEGVGVITRPDLRWGRCDIKSISLLPNVLARQSAAEEGCREAWLIDHEGMVTEGSASNAYIVDASGRLITHPLGERILGGVTRSVILELARRDGIEVVERPFSLDEARAREAGCPAPAPGCCPSPRSMAARSATACRAVVRRLMALYGGHLGSSDDRARFLRQSWLISLR